MLTTTKTITTNKLIIRYDNMMSLHYFNEVYGSCLFTTNTGRNSITNESDAISKFNELFYKAPKKIKFSTLLKNFNQSIFDEVLVNMTEEANAYNGGTTKLIALNDMGTEHLDHYLEEEQLFKFLSYALNKVGILAECCGSRGYSQGDYAFCLIIQNDGFLQDQAYINNVMWDAPMSFELLDDEGDTIDSCCGFYNVDDMKEYLPAEFANEDLQDYIETCHC